MFLCMLAGEAIDEEKEDAVHDTLSRALLAGLLQPRPTRTARD